MYPREVSTNNSDTCLHGDGCADVHTAHYTDIVTTKTSPHCGQCPLPKQHSQMGPSRAQPGPNCAQVGPNRGPHGMLLGYAMGFAGSCVFASFSFI